MGKLTLILIMTCGVVEAIMFPFGLADVYNHSNNIKMVEMALVVFIIIKVIIGG